MQESRKLKLLTYANLITLFGSAFVFIPISKNFSTYFGIGVSWALVYFIMRSPPVFFARLYANLANKYGLAQTLTYAQLCSVSASVILLIGVYFGLNYLAIFGFVLVCSFSLALRTLYPSFLNLVSVGQDELKRNIADWQSIIFGSAVFGIGIGGVMYDYFSIELFVLVDLLTFVIAYLIWSYVAKDLGGFFLKVGTQKTSFSEFTRLAVLPLNIVIFFKKLAYGFINPIAAVIFLEKFGLSTATFSLLFSSSVLFSLLSSRVAKRISISYNNCLFFSAIEIGLAVTFILSTSMILCVVSFFMADFFMVLADVNTETLYLDKYSKEFSNNLASVFSALRNGGQLMGYFVIIFLNPAYVVSTGLYGVIMCGLLASIGIMLAKHRFSLVDDDCLTDSV